MDFVAEQIGPPADGSNRRIVPLEVESACQEHLHAGFQLRDALRDPEHKHIASKPAAQLLGEMVCCS